MIVNFYTIKNNFFSRIVKFKARFWRLVWIFFYRPTPWFMYRYRVWLLNVFGANIAKTAHPENSAFVEFPWNLVMLDQSSIGEFSWIYCLNKIEIGKNTCIGQRCQLITGSHDFKSVNFDMQTSPIKIGDNCWLTSDVTVLMGVSIGNSSVVGAKSLVTKSIPENKVAFGNPAKVYSNRFEDYNV